MPLWPRMCTAVHNAASTLISSTAPPRCTQGLGGPSQQWFVEEYGRQGVSLDRMLMWEATPHNMTELLGVVPPHLLAGYQVRGPCTAPAAT